MFLLRSAFWFSFVALLMPHEPGLGGGSPTGIDVAGKGSQLVASLQKSGADLGMLADFQQAALAGLLRVKAELGAPDLSNGFSIAPSLEELSTTHTRHVKDDNS